jgi:hypothetical protein
MPVSRRRRRLFAGGLVVAAFLWTASSLLSETLSFQKLGADESVVIVYRSAGCFHYVVRFYEIRGGDAPTFGIVEHETYQVGEALQKEVNKSLGVGRLRKNEVTGLDSYVLYLRHGASGGCTTRDAINIGYYRKGQLIGEEKFVDDSCALLTFNFKEGVISSDSDDEWRDRCPPDFPKAVFLEITPPWLIEARIVARATTLPKVVGITKAPPAGLSTLLPLWLSDIWREEHQAARSAVIFALRENGLDPREYYAEVSSGPDEKYSVCLWHESALINRGAGIRGDPTGKCRTVVYDGKAQKISSISGWR